MWSYVLVIDIFNSHTNKCRHWYRNRNNQKKEIIKNIFIKFGIQTKHPIPTAWEYKFSNTNEPKWVIITLSSGKIVRGLYGTSSFSSSDEQFRDIYLQEVYMQKSEGMWEKVDRSDGIWVSPKEISLIEFKN